MEGVNCGMSEKTAHHMYYIAIVCPAAINEKVLQYKLWMQQFGCRVALKSPAHITLVAPFYFEETKEIQLKETLRTFTFHKPSINIMLDGFSHFGKRVIFISVKKNPLLEELSNMLNRYYRQLFAGVMTEDKRPFNPHVTIANRDVKPSAFIKAWECFSAKRFDESFESSAISLLRLTDGKWEVITQKDWMITG